MSSINQYSNNCESSRISVPLMPPPPVTAYGDEDALNTIGGLFLCAGKVTEVV